MTGFKATLFAVLNDAAGPGSVREPTALLKSIRNNSQPVLVQASVDHSSAAFEALEEDVGFIRVIRTTGRELTAEQRERWVALVRWLTNSLREWESAKDKRLDILAAILAIGQCCGESDGLWHRLPADSAPRRDFITTVRQLIAGQTVAYEGRGIGSVPIWESEFVERFQQADARGDWAEIAAQWPQLEHAAIPSFFSNAMVLCLAHYDFNELVRATVSLSHTPLVMQVANALSTPSRLRLALLSQSARIRFCCAYATVAHRGLNSDLSASDESALCSLLVKVASSHDEWRAWMTAFNTSPIRYPKLQTALGHALAAAPPEAADAYMDALQLYTFAATKPNKSRSIVATCLRAFSQRASLQHRKEVWARSFFRWKNWNFDSGSRETHLFEICRSELDFAVVSYAYECLSQDERESFAASIKEQLAEIELAWYPAETECTTQWNRLLSVFQPYAHAMVVASEGEDALAEGRVYWPFDASKSLYHRIMFRINPATLGDRLQIIGEEQPGP